MPKVTIHVWHTVDGEIVAIGQPLSSYDVVPISDANQSVLEIEIDEKLIGKLHQTHVVDIQKKALVKIRH